MVMDFSYLDSMMEDELDDTVEDVGEGYRHVWVVAETSDGALTPAALEAMGQGRDIADQFGVYMYAVLVGSGLDEELAQNLVQCGADKVLLIDDPALAQYQVETYVQVLADLVNERRPEILLMPASPLGNDLAPRLAQRLETGLMSHCVQLSLDMAERQLVGSFPVMGGEYFHPAVCPEARPQIATLEPGAFSPAYEDTYRTGDVERVPVVLDGVKGELIWLDLDAVVDKLPIPLTEARVIVSVGRGMQDEAGLVLAQQLADALGGQVAGSRGAFDEGWIDEEQQVGMAGQTVEPDLYIACGISGAIQHYLGMQDAGFVVAINRNEQAPIMSAANVSVVGDAKEVISALLEELKAA